VAENTGFQFFKYVLVALVSIAGQYLVFGALLSNFDLYPTLASALGYLFGSVINYALNYFFSFRSQHRHAATIARFYGAVAFGFVINSSCMFLFTGLLDLPIWPSQVASSAITISLNFSVMKWLVFDR